MSTLAIGGLSALTAFRLAEQRGEKGLEITRRDPMVSREIDYFKDNIDKVSSVDELFRNYRLVKFVLESVGLDNEIQYLGRAKKILSERVDDDNALMNRLTDKRWKSAAELLQLGEKGIDNLKSQATKDKLIDYFVKFKYEETLRQQNSAVPLARYFIAKADSISNAYEILGDAKLRHVVTTTLGLPLEIAYQEVETQAEAVTRRLDIKKLKDPDFVQKFAERFMIMSDMKAQEERGGGQSWLLNLFV